MRLIKPSISHAKPHSTRTNPLLASRIILHLLANFHVNLEEFRDTTVQANGFSLVEITLPVICWNTFFRTRLDKALNPNYAISSMTTSKMCFWLTDWTYQRPSQFLFLLQQSSLLKMAVDGHHQIRKTWCTSVVKICLRFRSVIANRWGKERNWVVL